MPGFLSNIKKIFLDALFAPICAHCRKTIPDSENFLCAKCFSSVKLNKTMFCSVCRARIPENRKICHFDSPYLLAAATDYNDPAIQSAIHYLKYKRVKSLAGRISEIMIDYVSELNFDFSGFIVTPIPLHRKKEFSRGFNQSRIIAEQISEKLNLPPEDLLIKIKNNKQQAGLRDYEKRKENAGGCFAVKNPESVSGKNIILIDDVFTSGATMNEAVKILKSNGARKIVALVAAKA
jgi:ComF family protein